MSAAWRPGSGWDDDRGDPGPTEPPAPYLRANGSGPQGQGASDLFRRHTAAELVRMDRTFSWLVRGMLVDPTYGQIAGEEKTLKSYVATFVHLGIAAGVPIFGRFKVDEARTVVVYVGEGGRAPYTRRLERIAAAMGVDLDNTGLHLSFDIAPIGSMRFVESLARDLDELRPGLVGLDPLYAYHGTTSKASDLHQEGSLLSSLSAPCMEAGASLLINNHFNQTGAGSGLKRITQAGSGEWADSWLLVAHREAPDVEAGRFRLLLEIGSRQWGGSTWDLDLELGRFDADTGEYEGEIAWHLARHRAGPSDHDEARVLEVVGERPFELTKEELARAAGGELRRLRHVVDLLETKGRLTMAKSVRMRSHGKPQPVWTFGPVEPAELPEQF